MSKISADDPEISPDAFFWALETIGRQLRLPPARNAIAHEFPPPLRLSTLQRAAQSLGASTRLQSLERGFETVSLPCYCVLGADAEIDHAVEGKGRDRSRQVSGAGPCSIARVIESNGRTVLLEEPMPASLRRVPSGDIEGRVVGPCLHVVETVPAQSDPDQAEQPAGFGLQWFARELLRYRSIWRDVVLASIAVQLLALVVPLLTQVIIDKVIVHRTVNTLIVVAAALAFAAVFSAAITWIRQYLVLHTGTRIDAVLGAQVFEHLLRLPPRFFERRPTGVLVARLHGIETIREFLAGAALTLLLDLPFMIVFAAIMFYYSPTLTWIAVAILCILIVSSLAITPLLRARINRQFLAGARHQAFVTEHLAAMETVKSLQLEPRLTDRFGTLFADYLAAGFNARRLASTFNVVAQTLEQLLTVAILCVGAWLIMSGNDLTIGGLVAFQMFAARLAGPMLRIAGLWQEFQQVEVAIRRLADIMNVPIEPYALTATRTLGHKGALRCRDLGFRYTPSRPWLFRHLSFAVEPGQCVALIGPSGYGKSTIARLLIGFYIPTEGEILIDDANAGDMAANQLRSYFGVVPQETRLFAAAILDNLLDVAPGAGVEDAIEACKLAQVHTAIEALPDGYLTAIGENGIGLSGGQKQRIAIARALIKRPRILIFDEVTSSLDAELSASLVATINALRGQVSVLFIAHAVPPGLQVDAVVDLGGAVDGGGQER